MKEELNILHYYVGMNKRRGGGLTKYVDDLISYQKNNNNIFILYPGRLKIFNKKIKIKEEKKVDNVRVFAIINPLPLPMMFGVQSMDYLNKKSDINIWKKFLTKNNIQIIHMHTIMGIYEEFLDAANELSIPIIYTTHDYFGICPKQTLFNNGEICREWISCINCDKCNSTAMPMWKLYLIHTKLFSYIRNLKIIKILKSKEKNKINTTTTINGIVKSRIKKEYNKRYYLELKEKMHRMLKKVTFYHFNSSITSSIFQSAIPDIKGEILNISHRDIINHRKIRKFSSKNLRVTYLGPIAQFKGFYDIIDSIDEIYNKHKNIVLNIFSYTNIERPYLIKHNGGYKHGDLEEIFNNTDVLIAPSRWPETFGFTVLEALSYAIPVIVTEQMGAKDLIVNGETGYIIKNDEISKTLEILMNNIKILEGMNINICSTGFKTFDSHCEDIFLLYNKILNEKRKKI